MGVISWISSWTNSSQLSIADKQQITSEIMGRIVSEIFTQMKVAYFQGEKQIFANPLGLSYDEVIQGFGPNAMELVRLATLLKDALNVAVPNTIPDNDNPYGVVDLDTLKKK